MLLFQTGWPTTSTKTNFGKPWIYQSPFITIVGSEDKVQQSTAGSLNKKSYYVSSIGICVYMSCVIQNRRLHYEWTVILQTMTGYSLTIAGVTYYIVHNWCCRGKIHWTVIRDNTTLCMYLIGRKQRPFVKLSESSLHIYQVIFFNLKNWIKIRFSELLHLH